MLQRIRKKHHHHGLKEREAVHLVQAFVISRIAYGTTYLNLAKAELDKLNVVTRKVHKFAPRLPDHTATRRMMEIGVRNTVEELIEAQLIAQLKRLHGTPNGRWLLDTLNLAVREGT